MARTTKTNKHRRRSVKRRCVRKRSGGGEVITGIVQNMDQDISMDQDIPLLTKYIDKWVGTQKDMNGKLCIPDHIYSDHVQLKRKVDDELTVFTNNVSFVLMAWAETKRNQNSSTFCIENKNQQWLSKYINENLPSEALLVNALVNSQIGQAIAQPHTTDPTTKSFKSFIHKFLAQQVETQETLPSIVCLQEAIVDYIVSDTDIKKKYNIAYSQTGPEGSVILIDKKQFKCISPTDDVCISNTGQDWAICGKKGRAWSFVVVESITTKKYLIINIHGTHPKTDADHEYPKDTKFGQKQVWCFQKWLQDTFKITETADKTKFNATINTKTYENIDKVILAGDFNDEIGSHKTNQWRGKIRNTLNNRFQTQTPSNVLWNRLGADVQQHDANPNDIIPTNGHLALGSEMRAAGDMILCAVPSGVKEVQSEKMKLASSGLPEGHYFGEQFQDQLGTVSFNTPYSSKTDSMDKKNSFDYQENAKYRGGGKKKTQTKRTTRIHKRRTPKQ